MPPLPCAPCARQRAKVFGLKERGKGEGTFKPATGTGYVKKKDGDYAHALAQNHDVRCLLFETFGGFGRDVERLFKTMAFSVMDKMSKSQYEDEASWSTRTWTALQCQRLSVVLHIAAATEIINELGYGDGEAAAGRRAYGNSDGRRRRRGLGVSSRHEDHGAEGTRVK